MNCLNVLYRCFGVASESLLNKSLFRSIFVTLLPMPFQQKSNTPEKFMQSQHDFRLDDATFRMRDGGVPATETRGTWHGQCALLG
jgi:hypothetical protein